MRARTLMSFAVGLLLTPLGGCCFSHCNVCLVDDTATTAVDQPVVIDVLANDKIGDKVTINSVTTQAVSQGSAVVNTDNTITYTPEAGATGEATFEYQVCYTCERGKYKKSSCKKKSDETDTTDTTEPTCQTAKVTVTIGDSATVPDGNVDGDGNTTPTPEPASVLLVNKSNFEITVSVGGKEVDVVQPLGSTVVPADVASGNQAVKVEALLPAPDPARETSSSFEFAPTGKYTITYTDDNVSPASIGVAESQ